jgi:hypothetical protein
LNQISPFITIIFAPLDIGFIFKAFQSAAGIASIYKNQIGKDLLCGPAAFLVKEGKQVGLGVVKPQSGKVLFRGLVPAAGKHHDQVEKFGQIVHSNSQSARGDRGRPYIICDGGR